MRMATRNFIAGILCLLGLTACLGSLVTSSNPPKYYELDYPYQPVDCVRNFDEALRIWPLSAAAPYDRDEMVILDPSRQVRFSSQYKWVALPGTMIADMLLRDMTRNELFPKVVSPGAPFNAPIQLGGNLFEFAWEEDAASARAVLDLEMSLWSEVPRRSVLFRRHYHFESPPASKGSSEQLAGAMSELVDQFSRQLRQDLCSVTR
jgi:ABC-type uncharacterized transport system auxiliary subunit